MDEMTYQNLIDYLRTHEYPSNYTNEQKRKLARTAINYFEKNSILFYKNRDNPLRVITTQNRNRILYNYHTSPLGGHFGIKHTIENVKRNYYWPNMGNDIREYIESCNECQMTGKPKRDPTIIPIKVTEPFDQIGIDFVGPLKISSKGNRYIIVATDYLTKWPEALPVKSAKAKEVASFLYEEIICRHGVPSSMISDHGAAFLGKVIELLKEEVGFKHKLAAPYHPQTNGLTERFNGTLCKALGKCVNSANEDWDDLIPSVLFAYRTLKHSTTKHSPFYLLHGKEAQLPIHLELMRNEQIEIPYEEALERRIGHILGTFTDALILAKDNIGTVQQLQEERTRKLKKIHTFQEDDLVILYDASKQNVHGDKFTLRWTGPYYIHKRIGDKTVILRDKTNPTKLSQPTSTNLIKHYKLRDL
jgi:Integrase zinc binding domain/Integrase core domain